MTEEKYYYWLQSLSYFTHDEIIRMVSMAGSPEALFEIPGKDLYKFSLTPTFNQVAQYDLIRSEEKVEDAWLRMEAGGLRFVSVEEEEYPELLRAIPDYPFGLFYRGSLPRGNVPSVAIVGARRCTNYGKDMAYFFGRELAKAGVQVVSGMALGIDGFSQRGAIAGGGKSFAVLGCGADICYPRENIDLYESLKENGGILSERMPGTPALPKDFPIRNRIISGLSDVLIVIEAAEHSGSLITVNLALSQNREVFALPGRVGDRMSKGCNELLKNGAQVLTCPEDVLQYLGITVGKETEKKKRVLLTKEEETVFQHFSHTPVSMDALLGLTGFPVGTLSEILVNLEIKGLVKREGIGGYAET